MEIGILYCRINCVVEVASSVAPYVDIMEVTTAAWHEVDTATFQASWVVTGYFDKSHFENAIEGAAPGVDSAESAKMILDPTGLLEGTTLLGTPQFCTTFEWRIED